ncbi:MAG: hypothetical protein M1823_000909 [Watsoniomyces obsoletus]|nr:MAG: hypothetical protein M1823_000909 [Watsoniomyces obsoletus]
MAEPPREYAFKDLYIDLLDLTNGPSGTSFYDVDKLLEQVNAWNDDFANLLDKAPKNDQSRRSVLSGRASRLCKVTIDEDEYGLNEEFQQNAIQLADNLGIDELQAVQLLLTSEGDAELLGRSSLSTAHFTFHSRRKELLGCLRLIFKFAIDEEVNEEVRNKFQDVVRGVVQSGSRPGPNGPSFMRRCLLAMGDVKTWVHQLDGKVQNASIIGVTLPPDTTEILNYQKTSLLQQCEDLGAIGLYLVKLGHSDIKDFEMLLDMVMKIEKYENTLVYYLPLFLAFISTLASPEGRQPFTRVQSLHERITDPARADEWSLRFLRAAVILWWISEYNSWFAEPHEQVLAARVDADRQNEVQAQMLFDVLGDGAFDFTLSLCADVKATETSDTLRSSLRHWLQRKAPIILPNPVPFSHHFQLLLMEQLETHVDALITNMPGNLRRLRVDQDERRLRLLEVDPNQQDLDLEKLLMIMAYVFEDRPEAAKNFWLYPDSNWSGFLQWSSKRLSTPRACAVGEMLVSLSTGEENATSAHQFLLEESQLSGAKPRKSVSLSWAQMLGELEYTAKELGGPASDPRKTARRSSRRSLEEVHEPETYNMLESYLRLTAAVCGQSTTAREWLLTQTSHPLLDVLFLVCANPVPSRMRACAFDVMAATLIDKTLEQRDTMWAALDSWVYVGLAASSDRPKVTNTGLLPAWSADAVFERITHGFEEMMAFVTLLVSLVTPCRESGPLNDALPFPESLGAAYRMPSMDSYVDFVLGQIFRRKSSELHDLVQQRSLRLRCLDFVAACLATFNEDLVVFGWGKNVFIDPAIQSTSIEVYVRLHPFARVMGWLFDDQVLRVLFETARQDVEEVARNPAESVLVQCLQRTIQVLTLMHDLQATYHDIIRPAMDASSTRSIALTNSSWASLEDVVLQDLYFIVSLGLYATTEHTGLVLASLNLLEKLATSPKLNTPHTFNVERGSDRNKIVAVYEQNHEAERVAGSMRFQMLPDAQEQKRGADAPAYAIKLGVLRFLKNCLEAVPNRPNLAHLLLGFSCTDTSIEIVDGSDLAQGSSLFHSIRTILSTYPDVTFGTIQGWLLGIKQLTFDILHVLWSSSLSSTYTLTELRSQNFLPEQLVRVVIINSETPFDGRSVLDPEFLLSSSAECCDMFLHQRALLLEYVAMEIRVLAAERVPTLKTRAISAVLGAAMGDDHGQLVGPSIIDLFDFAEMELEPEMEPPALGIFAQVNFEQWLQMVPRGFSVYDLGRMEQLLTLRMQEEDRKGNVTEQDQQRMRDDAVQIMNYAQRTNNRIALVHTRLALFKAWTQVVIIVLEDGDLDPASKEGFILQVLQLILPKLERYSRNNPPEALELARLAKTLLLHVDFTSPSFSSGHANDVAADRLHQLFLVSLRGIHTPTATSALRELFYVICHRYCTGFCENWSGSGSITWHGTRALKAAGEALMDTVSEDAFAGDGLCRMSALLFLDGLTLSSQKEGSTYVVDSLTRINFLALLMDSIRLMPTELGETAPSEVPLLLALYDAQLSLLLRIAQTRVGATRLFDAGLFRSVRTSGLFSVDPDLGFEVDNPNALENYYRLVLAMLRIIVAVVMSCGPHHQRTLQAAREFLLENRPSMVTIFKRNAKIGTLTNGDSPQLTEVARHFMLLVIATDFLSFEEGVVREQSAPIDFT